MDPTKGRGPRADGPTGRGRRADGAEKDLKEARAKEAMDGGMAKQKERVCPR